MLYNNKIILPPTLAMFTLPLLRRWWQVYTKNVLQNISHNHHEITVIRKRILNSYHYMTVIGNWQGKTCECWQPKINPNNLSKNMHPDLPQVSHIRVLFGYSLNETPRTSDRGRSLGITGSLIKENRQLVINEPVEVQDCRKITDHFRGIYRVYPSLIKDNWKMSTCNRFDLGRLGYWLVIPRNLPGTEPVEILVFASPTGYMLTSSGFPLWNWGIFYKFLLNDWQFSCSLELQPVISQTQLVHL